MRKHLLFALSLGVSAVAFGQNARPTGAKWVKVSPQIANKAVKKAKVTDDHQTVQGSLAPFASTSAPSFIPRTGTETIIGKTYYQLQTNSSVTNATVNNPDGTISAVWTMATDANFTTRGTGYNYYNGSAWNFPTPGPTSIIETQRAGFTNIQVTASGREVTAAHLASNVAVTTRPTKGTGAWTMNLHGRPNVWNRIAAGAGETIHLIGHSSGTSATNVLGQDGAIAYSRTSDGGATWDIYQQVIPGIDSTYYLGFGGDAYAIDARGNTVAIVGGGEMMDVVMVKSNDNGATWTKTVVNPFPVPFYEADMGIDLDQDGVADTVTTNDSSFEIILDNNNVAHVFYGNMRVLDEDLTDGNYSYFPGTSGIMYWNEYMGASAPVLITDILDEDGDMTFNLPTNPDLAFGNYGLSLTSMMSAGISASGRIYLAYAGVRENTNSGLDKAFRNVYMISTVNNGLTWADPVNISDNVNLESVFPSMARRVDQFVHMTYQSDENAGHGVSTSPDTENQGLQADIVYNRTDTALLPVSVKEIAKANNNSISVYPNPASDFVTIAFSTEDATSATVTIVNAIGAEVAKFSNNVAMGSTLNINVQNYPAGIYFINATIGNKVITEKVIVK